MKVLSTSTGESINAGPDTWPGSAGHYQSGTVSVAGFLQIQQMLHDACEVQPSKPLVLWSLLLPFFHSHCFHMAKIALMSSIILMPKRIKSRSCSSPALPSPLHPHLKQLLPCVAQI